MAEQPSDSLAEAAVARGEVAARHWADHLTLVERPIDRDQRHAAANVLHQLVGGAVFAFVENLIEASSDNDDRVDGVTPDREVERVAESRPQVGAVDVSEKSLADHAAPPVRSKITLPVRFLPATWYARGGVTVVKPGSVGCTG
jgi:hypothetical protein